MVMIFLVTNLFLDITITGINALYEDIKSKKGTYEYFNY